MKGEMRQHGGQHSQRNGDVKLVGAGVGRFKREKKDEVRSPQSVVRGKKVGSGLKPAPPLATAHGLQAVDSRPRRPSLIPSKL